MATGTNTNGKTINVGDRVSILGTVVSISGTGSLATVTVQPPLSTSTFTGKANDMNAVQTDPASAAKSISGKAFGNAGDQVSVLGVVTAISGSGQSALLTMTLASSQASVNGVPAGATNSDNV